MIELTDTHGRPFLLQGGELLEVQVAGASQMWHGVQSNVRTSKGWREVRESYAEITAKLAEMKK